MIFGIGTDIVQISRMKDNLDKHGLRFAKRILSAVEFAEFENVKNANSQGAFLAKRFAAKEAAVKAIGTGFRDGISMTHISVGHDAMGKPVLEFTDVAKSIALDRGVTNMHLSIADESEYAVAYVVLER
ncbi:MAG: holo-ACP synthase [Gammaproteobacteria bacterium]|nr:holo-ACP synthase [Gammaproteobacteria bacterium]